MRRDYPACAKCSIIMDPRLYDDVSPGYQVEEGIICPECFKDYLRDLVDSDPPLLASALGVPILYMEGEP